MSSQKEKPSIINPAHIEDAKQAFAQLTPAEQAALEAKTAYVFKFLRQGKSLEGIIDELSKEPQVAQAYSHLKQIPDKPAG